MLKKKFNIFKNKNNLIKKLLNDGLADTIQVHF